MWTRKTTSCIRLFSKLSETNKRLYRQSKTRPLPGPRSVNQQQPQLLLQPQSLPQPQLLLQPQLLPQPLPQPKRIMIRMRSQTLLLLLQELQNIAASFLRTETVAFRPGRAAAGRDLFYVDASRFRGAHAIL